MSIINDALKKLQTEMHLTKTDSISPEKISPVPMMESPSVQASYPTEQDPGLVTPIPIPKPDLTPKKESRIIYILGILCLLTALFAPIVNRQSVLGMLWQKLPKHIPQISAPPSAPVASDVQARSPQPIESAEPKREPVRTLMETFKAPETPTRSQVQPKGGRIIVNGIMSSGSRNLALIDGQVYEEGEEVNGSKILKINPNSVVIVQNGQERIIKVMGQ